jgi:hypothetical protein
MRLCARKARHLDEREVVIIWFIRYPTPEHFGLCLGSDTGLEPCGFLTVAILVILTTWARAQFSTGRSDKPETIVSGHKFKIGQLVNYLGRDRAYGVYQVTQLLPPEGKVFQYRIKNINEPHERVAKESELRRV